MTLGGILIGVALLVVVAPLVLRPLFLPTATADAPLAGSPAPNVEVVLGALRDLDFDHQAGKVTDDDYAPARARLLAEAAAAMKQDPDSDLEALLEQKVRQVRQHLDDDRGPAAICPHCGSPISRGDRFCSHCGRALAPACPSCGRGVSVGDAFCTGCGRRLQPKEIAAHDGFNPR